jgi:hypothetical protein
MAGLRRRGCRFLLGILTLMLVSFPALHQMAQPILLCAVIAAVFVAGVIVVDAGGSHVRKAVCLASVQIGLTVFAVLQDGASFVYLLTVGFALVTATVLISYSLHCVVAYVLQAPYITSDQIYAGMCAYLMLGFAFGCIYYLTEILSPGCFSASTSKPGVSTPDLMYFSFVTLATLGYGDITPIANVSRALAELEALAGMLYIAVFMARLMSMAGGGSPTTIADDSHGAAVEPTGPERTAYVEHGRTTGLHRISSKPSVHCIMRPHTLARPSEAAATVGVTSEPPRSTATVQ